MGTLRTAPDYLVTLSAPLLDLLWSMKESVGVSSAGSFFDAKLVFIKLRLMANCLCLLLSFSFFDMLTSEVCVMLP